VEKHSLELVKLQPEPHEVSCDERFPNDENDIKMLRGISGHKISALMIYYLCEKPLRTVGCELVLGDGKQVLLGKRTENRGTIRTPWPL
jgi:hypothetical protein